MLWIIWSTSPLLKMRCTVLQVRAGDRPGRMQSPLRADPALGAVSGRGMRRCQMLQRRAGCLAHLYDLTPETAAAMLVSMNFASQRANQPRIVQVKSGGILMSWLTFRNGCCGGRWPDDLFFSGAKMSEAKTWCYLALAWQSILFNCLTKTMSHFSYARCPKAGPEVCHMAISKQSEYRSWRTFIQTHLATSKADSAT